MLMTGVLQFKAYACDNHRLLSYHDSGFCNMIITLSILLHITANKALFNALKGHDMIWCQECCEP